MTFKYAELAAGRCFRVNRGIAWEKIKEVVPCSPEGNELPGPTPRYWNKKVIDYKIDEQGIMFCRLEV